MRQVNDELSDIPIKNTKSSIALIHDYEADWMSELDGQGRFSLSKISAICIVQFVKMAGPSM